MKGKGPTAAITIYDNQGNPITIRNLKEPLKIQSKNWKKHNPGRAGKTKTLVESNSVIDKTVKLLDFYHKIVMNETAEKLSVPIKPYKDIYDLNFTCYIALNRFPNATNGDYDLKVALPTQRSDLPGISDEDFKEKNWEIEINMEKLTANSTENDTIIYVGCNKDGMKY